MAATPADAELIAAEAAFDHHRSLSLSNEKMGMWTFLASEITFFGALFTIYLVYMARHADGPGQQDVFNIPFTAGMTLILMVSSLATVLALNANRAGNPARFQLWTLGAALLGTVFLGMMFYEYSVMMLEGFTLSSSPMGAAFYVLTGAHGIHLVIGIVMLVSLWSASVTGRLDHLRDDVVESVSLYWHFVDLVWIVIFAVVYLVPVL
jgi:heme/copper-type cytochrome/quinol oxidase subunit 3